MSKKALSGRAAQTMFGLVWEDTAALRQHMTKLLNIHVRENQKLSKEFSTAFEAASKNLDVIEDVVRLLSQGHVDAAAKRLGIEDQGWWNGQ